MPDATTKPASRPRAPRKPVAPQPHKDMLELIQAMKRLAEALEPLTAHVPVLVEIAKTWNAAATTGRTIGHGATMLSGFGKWLGGMVMTLALIWALIHQKWEALLGALK